MKKRTYTILLLLISISFFVFVIYFLNKPKIISSSLSSMFISEDSYQEIINNRNKLNSSPIEELVFNGNRLFYDKQDSKFYYSISDSYNPNVEYNGTRYNIAFIGKEISDDSIHNNEPIKVLIYNNNNYYVCDLITTSLPLINININVALEDIEETYQDMHFDLYDNNLNQSYESFGSIRTRGSNIQRHPKKSFKIKLKNKNNENNDLVSLLDFPVSREFILYPAYNDQERIRNVFSTNLWYESCSKDNIYGLDNGQYYQYFELFINNKYWGLYAITYPIDENVLDLDINKESSNYLKEELYKKNNGAINEYNIDWNNRPIDGYDLKTNEDNYNAWDSLEYYYSVLFNTKDLNDIYELVDIDNSIDIFLFYNLIQGIDNVSIWGNKESMLHNTFMYSKVYKDSIKMLFTPWDMDRTWGNGRDEELYGIDITYNTIMYINPIFYLMDLNDENIRNAVIDRYTYLRDNEWSDEYILNMLDNLEEDIFYSGAYLRDCDRWKDSHTTDTELSRFKEYVLQRFEYLDTFIPEYIENYTYEDRY